MVKACRLQDEHPQDKEQDDDGEGEIRQTRRQGRAGALVDTRRFVFGYVWTTVTTASRKKFIIT